TAVRPRPARKAFRSSRISGRDRRPPASKVLAPEAHPPTSSRPMIVMRKFLNWLVLIPLGLIFVVFAVANRHLVTVSFDPINAKDPSIAIELPLFVVIIAVAILGVIAGGI